VVAVVALVEPVVVGAGERHGPPRGLDAAEGQARRRIEGRALRADLVGGVDPGAGVGVVALAGGRARGGCAAPGAAEGRGRGGGARNSNSSASRSMMWPSPSMPLVALRVVAVAVMIVLPSRTTAGETRRLLPPRRWRPSIGRPVLCGIIPSGPVGVKMVGRGA